MLSSPKSNPVPWVTCVAGVRKRMKRMGREFGSNWDAQFGQEGGAPKTT